MIITEILPYGKMKSRVLTDGDLVFSVYRSELREYGLEEGRELSEKMLEEVLFPLLTKRARERIVRLLKDRDYPEAELRRKLQLSFCPEQCASEALRWAREKHYVDDRRFAENYIRWNDGKSRRRLLFDLTQKGIGRELAEELLEEMPPDEEAQIRRELEKRNYRPDSADPKERQKIAAFLSRRGYSWSRIESAMRRAEEV
ncbi:MAG: regulatory protein RecX [Stomatobaculum sp.]|nr:regulatory protein RecX [Stomatobaculum sp.]